MTQPATSHLATHRDIHSAADLTLFQAEQEAMMIRWFEPLLVPGLLQTADYARAVLLDMVGHPPDVAERKLQIRLQRQAILDRPGARLDFVLDRAVLNRDLPAALRADQIRHLRDVGARPNVRVHIADGLYPDLTTPRVLVGLPDGQTLLYLEARDEARWLDTDEGAAWAERHERLAAAGADL